MAAAYAGLVSLMNIMEQIQNHPRCSINLDKKQIESLREKVDFLLEFIENDSHGCSEETQVLETQIASAAYAAEDVLESHVVVHIHAGSTKKTISGLLPDLQKLIEELDSIKEKVAVVKEKKGFESQQFTYSTPASSSRPLNAGSNAMVGFEDDLIQLMEGLTGNQSNRQIIPIVGMGGIGKTTLARNVYENSVIVQHFDSRAWVTVSQDYNVRKILLELLSCIRKQENHNEKTEHQLGEYLHKSLSGWRYLIILDDMWSIEVWGKIKYFFPYNNSRSRIVITTRLSDMVTPFGASSFSLKFLDEDKSWNLFCEKAFAGEGCPPELETIGKEIVRKCKGLPLAIVVIGGLLGKSRRTKKYWKNVSKDINWFLNSVDDELGLDILSLSYRHLPAHLKPCFLYTGVFPEDNEISVSQIIKLWVAEGFVKPNKSQILEEVAEGYIKDLVERNLILVNSLGSNGKIKTCKIHDLLRDLCLRVVEKEKFLTRGRNRKGPIEVHGRVPKIEYQPRAFHALQSASIACSSIHQPSWLCFKFRSKRILNVVYKNSLRASFQQINLRYLAYQPSRISIFKLPIKLPSSMSLLWNVQTIIITSHHNNKLIVVVPSGIWEMPQLRHLVSDSICLPDPPPSGQQNDFILRNLQTLKCVSNFRLSEEACNRIPNVKKLQIYYDNFSASSYEYCLNNLCRFQKLESLGCYFRKPPNRGDLLQNLTFPTSLKKLDLGNCYLQWEDLTMIGSLPHLEVLKLGWFSVRDDEWSPAEGGFLRLKFLGIQLCYLAHWNADSSHFPVLENLDLVGMFALKEIPSGVGEIPTLQRMVLHQCRESLAISAIRILEEQESLGNEGLQVRIHLWDKAEAERLREKVRLENFTSNNFQVILL